MGNKKSRDSRERRSEADQPNAETHLSQNEITLIWSHWESLKPHKLKLAKKILKVYLKEHPKARGITESTCIFSRGHATLHLAVSVGK